jgi:hypothetical protein
MGSFVSSIAGPLLSIGGGLISGGKGADAARGQAESLRAAGIRASEMAQFRPIGLKTAFGSSNFKVNDLGQVTEAGYTLDPQLEALRNRFTTGATGYDPTRLQQLTEPVYGATESLFNLGGSYLGANPQEVAAKYISDRQGLLQPSRAAEFGRINARNYATGRGGLGVNTGTGGAPANPALQAYYNSIFQQDKALAAEADTEAMNRIRFGGELYGAGGKLAAGIPSLFSGSFLPIETQLNMAKNIEALGQQPYQMSLDLANTQAGAGARAGQLYLEPQAAAANAYAKYQGYSPLGTAMSGLGSSISGGGFGGFGADMGIGGSGLNPYNRYGSGLFDWGRAPTGSTGFESWESPYIS